jgi:hypothetical protein
MYASGFRAARTINPLQLVNEGVEQVSNAHPRLMNRFPAGDGRLPFVRHINSLALPSFNWMAWDFVPRGRWANVANEKFCVESGCGLR